MIQTMDQTNENIVKEIVHLKSQYEDEIGKGGRKPWPKSIKERVLKLCRQGVPAGEVSRATGIPYHSILPWRREAGLIRTKAPHLKNKFHALTVTDQVSSPTVTDPVRSSTVTVKVRGLEIQLGSPKEAAEFIFYFEAAKGGSSAI